MWTEYDIPADTLSRTLEGVTVTLAIAPDDQIVEGNASAWGDEEDAAHAAEVRAHLDEGNKWAWCIVRITVTDGDAEGTSHLSGVSYWIDDTMPNESAIVTAFMADGYGRDMLGDAVAEYRADRDRLARKYCHIAY